MDSKIKAIVALVFSVILLVSTIWFTVLNATVENVVGVVFGTIATLVSIYAVWRAYRLVKPKVK